MNTSNIKDEIFMRQAINEAHKAMNCGEVPIGAVVVCNGMVVGRGYNMVESLSDATAHAEIQAITAAMASIGAKYLKDCTLYVTMEPCVMCAGACYWGQLGRVVYGVSDDKRGYKSVSEKILHPKTEVTYGTLEAECKELINLFFTKLRA